MALEAPNSLDVSEYQFKLHDKFQIFETGKELTSDINLLTTSSVFGLIFVGNQYKPELKVIQLQNLVTYKETGEQVLSRSVPLQGIPHNIAVSSDGTLLAVNCTHNGVGLLIIYDVSSFFSVNVIVKSAVRISADDNVRALQILWNPVVANSLALVLSDGSMSAYILKDSAYEFYVVDKQENVKCACWSPKGKQIVAGFPKGKLVQYKPDLKPARSIVCPPNIHEEPFNTIAVQWLSTYQFAVVFLQVDIEGGDMSPSLYIVNAPKIGQPTYINYYDICYSSTGPRKAQVFLTYIQPWNILLIASSNSMEVGVLGTTDSGEAPVWKQYITPDEARIELPLTSDKEETHPIGFSLETGTVHQLVVAEKQIPVMPMIHILSTHGMFISFNFLNFSSNAPGLCSPPRPVADLSGINQFQPITTTNVKPQQETAKRSITEIQQTQQTSSEVSFAVPSGATSTPSQERKTKPIFGDTSSPGNLAGNLDSGLSSFATSSSSQKNAATPTAFQQTGMSVGLPFGAGQTLGPKSAAPALGTSKPLFGGINFPQNSEAAAPESLKAALSERNKDSVAMQQTAQASVFGEIDPNQNKQTSESSDRNAPLYTVPATYSASQQKEQIGKELTGMMSASSASEDADAVKELTKVYIAQFEKDLRDLSNRSKDVDITIGNMDESKEVVKQLSKLEGVSNQAVESTESLAADIQGLRNTLNECFVMIADTKSKLNMLQNPELPELATLSNSNQTNRRQMIKLKSFLATNEAQLQIVNQQIDAQWSNYQDMYRKSKTKMRIPSLESVYQTLLKQKDILARERLKINYIKSRLGVKTMTDPGLMKNNDLSIESLADSILSMSLSEHVKAERASLTASKLKKLRYVLQNRNVIEIKPKRPERIGVKSEVIREMRIKIEKANIREGASTKPEKMEKQRIKHEASQTIAKPTPTKPTSIAMTPQSFAALAKPKPITENAQPAAFTAVPSGTSVGLNANALKPAVSSQVNKEKVFSALSGLTDEGTVNSFSGSISQKLGSSAPVISFGGNAIAKPTAQMPFASAQTKNSPLLAFAAKNDKPLEKPVFGMSNPNQASGESGVKNLSADIFQPKPIQSERPFVAFGGPSEVKSIPFGAKTEITSNQPVAPAMTKPQAVSENIADSKPKEKSDEKQSGPFAMLNFGKPTSTGGGFSFGATSSSGSTIFGGQGSVFGAQTQQASIVSSQLAASTTAVVPSTTGGFVPVSSAIDEDKTSEISGASTTANLDSFPTIPKTTTVATAEPTSTFSTFSFLSKADSTPSTTSSTVVVSLPSSSATVFTTSTPAVSSSGFSFAFGKASTPGPSPFSFAALAKDISVPTTVTGANDALTKAPVVSSVSSPDPAEALLSSLNICKPASVATTSSITQATGGSIFGGNAFTLAASTSSEAKTVFGATTTTTSPSDQSSAVAAVTATPPTLASATPLNLSVPSITSEYAAPQTTTPTIFATPTISSVQSVFNTSTSESTSAPVPSFGSSTSTTATFGMPATAVATSSSAFGSSASTFSFSAAFAGGMPKPDQTVFEGNTGTSGTVSMPFGSTSIQANPFGGSPASQAVSGGSMFSSSGGTIGFGQQPSSPVSIFGGSATAQQPTAFGAPASSAPSIFTAQKSEGSNVFGSAAQAPQSSGASFFGQTAFGSGDTQTSGSIFASGSTSPIQPGAFSSAPAFGQTVFSVAQPQQQATSPFAGSSAFGTGFGGFGGTTPAFGSTSPGGSFAHAGQPSVAQTGFGSPGSFAKPAFAANPAFGGTPAFGGSPTFGGAPTFGSPKGTFGSFAQPQQPTFSPPAQKNSLFESLGSSESGLSFSNLAQNTNNNPGAKQQFGGSSFSTWR